MDWNSALSLISKNIHENLPLNPLLRYGRKVILVPPYLCRNHNWSPGFCIQIGKNAFINIPLSMLQDAFNDAKANNNIYNAEVFRRQYRNLSSNSCYTQTIGRIFILAGVATQITARNYLLL